MPKGYKKSHGSESAHGAFPAPAQPLVLYRYPDKVRVGGFCRKLRGPVHKGPEGLHAAGWMEPARLSKR